MISTPQLAAALYGVRRLLAFDVKAWAYFDKTPGGILGFLRHCLCPRAPSEPGGGRCCIRRHPHHLALVPYMVVQVLAYVLQWTLFPFVMMYMVRLLQRPGRYFDYMVPYNWLQLPLGLFFYTLQLAAALNLISLQMAPTDGAICRMGGAVYLWRLHCRRRATSGHRHGAERFRVRLRAVDRRRRTDPAHLALRIAHVGQVEAGRRSGLTAGGAVAGFQRAGHIPRFPFSFAHKF